MLFFLQHCLGKPHSFNMWARPLATAIIIRCRNFCLNALVQSCSLVPSSRSPCRAICLPYAATINSCKLTVSVPISPYVVATAAKNTGSCARRPSWNCFLPISTSGAYSSRLKFPWSLAAWPSHGISIGSLRLVCRCSNTLCLFACICFSSLAILLLQVGWIQVVSTHLS